MKQRVTRRSAMLLLVVALAAPQPARAAGFDGFGRFLSALQGLVTWVARLQRSMDPLVFRERYRRLRNHLARLASILPAIDGAIGRLIIDLGTPRVRRQTLERDIAQFSGRVRQFRDALDPLSALLMQSGPDGRAVEGALREALDVRESWLARLRSDVHIPARRPGLIREGRRARAVLRQARLRLGQVMERLP